ncbi:hypothetical protein D3C78_1356710 [compost metagenome]
MQASAGTLDGVLHLLLEVVGVEEHQRRIEAQQQQAGPGGCLRMFGQVMESGDALDLAQHIHPGSRGEHDEADQREDEHHQNRLDGAHPDHANSGQHREGEFDPAEAQQQDQAAHIQQ